MGSWLGCFVRLWWVCLMTCDYTGSVLTGKRPPTSSSRQGSPPHHYSELFCHGGRARLSLEPVVVHTALLVCTFSLTLFLLLPLSLAHSINCWTVCTVKLRVQLPQLSSFTCWTISVSFAVCPTACITQFLFDAVCPWLHLSQSLSLVCVFS